MRIFLAIEIPLDIKGKLVEVQEKLEPRIPDVRWEKAEKMHITLVFLGEVSEERIKDLEDTVREGLKGIKGLKVELSEVAVFPNEKRPRVVLVDIGKGREEIERLQGKLEEKLSAAGFNFKPGKRPHVTLGRFKKGVKDIGPEVDAAHHFRVKFEVRKIVIVESKLHPKGAIHTPIVRISLGERGKRGELGA